MLSRKNEFVGPAKDPTPSMTASSGLKVSEPNSVLEREAEQVADETMASRTPRMNWSLSKIAIDLRAQRKRACDRQGASAAEKTDQRKTASQTFDGGVSPIVTEVLSSPGRPLDKATRSFFERRFGHDFSHVHVHTDTVADQSAQAVKALAYTVGSHLVFAWGKYAPDSRQGQKLLTHELTHVVQQGGTAFQTHEPKATTGDATRVHKYSQRQGSASGTQVVLARQPKPGEEAGEVQDEQPVRDKWKGTLVSEIVISLARSRVGFRIPQGMLLGTVKTDLAVGNYQLTPVLDKQQWIIEGPGVKGGLRFSVDLTESNADPWTLAYPDKLTLTVSAGARGEPKTFGEAIDPNTSKEKDPLWVYEGWSNTGPPQLVADVDDYETIELDKQSITPTADKPKPTSPLYRVKYRDNSERTFSYGELTPKMRAQLQPIF